jgi:hypothetical protein
LIPYTKARGEIDVFEGKVLRICEPKRKRESETVGVGERGKGRGERTA